MRSDSEVPMISGKNWLKAGLIILILSIMVIGIAGKGCPWLPGYHDDDDDVTTGSSGAGNGGTSSPNASAIAAGGGHSLTLLSDKTIQTWGYNKYGELGDGSTVYSSLPIWVSGFSGSNDTNRAPMLNAIGPKTGDPSQLLSFTISALDPNEDTLTYSATGLPTGATFDPTTRSFNWTPSTTGSYPGVKFTVTDPDGLSDEETIEITVVASSPPYDVTFLVLDDLTKQHLTDLSVDCDSGWFESNLSSPITHSYSEGTYSTLFTKTGYGYLLPPDPSWNANSHKTFTIYMVKTFYWPPGPPPLPPP